MILQLRAKRADLLQEARAVLNDIETAQRSMTADERSKWDDVMAEADALKATIDRVERTEAEERALYASRRQTRTYDSAGEPLRAWLGNDAAPKALTLSLRTDPLRQASDRNEWESRALSTVTTTSGGYTVPQDFANTLEIALMAHDGVRQSATVIRTASGNQLPWPTSNDTANEGVLLDENAEADELDIAFGTKQLNAYKISSGIVRVSRELVQDSGVNIGQVVGDMLGTRIGRALNNYHTTGTGSSQFEGVATAATASGVTSATLGSVTFAELVQLQHSVDPAYRASAVWVFNDATLAAIKQLVDEQGRPLFLPSMVVGEPGTILGHRYIINQHMADVSTASARSILFGNLSKFVIRDVADITIVRSDDRYFEYDQIAFHGLYRGDSVLVDAGTNPVKYLANAAS